MGLFGGKTETEYGVRFGGKDTWNYNSKTDAEKAVKRMNKSVKKGGTQAKLIQRTKQLTAIKGRPKNTCRGGKCNKRGNVCKKHFADMTRGTRARNGALTQSEYSLDNIHKRWDEEGHRWS